MDHNDFQAQPAAVSKPTAVCKQIKFKNFLIPFCNMRRREKDKPDLTLIIEGSRRSHPTRRIQGQDYPTTVLEQIEQRAIFNFIQLSATDHTTDTSSSRKLDIVEPSENSSDTSSSSNENEKSNLGPPGRQEGKKQSYMWIPGANFQAQMRMDSG
jgi:hypothetical protein